MTDALVSQLGITNGSTDGSWLQDNELFLKTFSGEVLTAFDETNVFRALHMTRSISSGKSAQFPATWKGNARYHKAGTPVLGSNKIKHNERVIFIDDKLLADIFLDEVDELKNHYDVRGEYANQMGSSLARAYDKTVAIVITKAARARATIAGANGGSALTNASAKTDGEVLAGMIYNAAQVLDEKDVDEADRYAAFKPAQYYLMAQTTKLINKDWDGKGSYSDGKIVRVADVEIVKSNNVPSTKISSATDGENNDYTGDFRKTVGTVFHRSAAGTVSLMDLVTQMTGDEVKVMYQGTVLVSKYVLGHGILRPESAVELALP